MLSILFLIATTGCDLLETGASDAGFLAEPGPILFTAFADESRACGVPLLYSMQPDGSDIRQLTDDIDIPASGITFAPDGRRAVASGPSPGSGGNSPQNPWGGLYVMDADGTNRRLFFDYEPSVPNSASGGSPIIWSPDGEQLIFHRLLMPASAGQVAPFLVNADGTNPRQLTDRSSSL